LNGPDFTISDAAESIEKALLPSKVFDKSDRLQNLLCQANSLIGNFVDASSSGKKRLHCLCQERNTNYEEAKSSQGTVGQIDNEDHQSDDASNRRSPNEVEHS
jgi:hypothetical protein